MNSKNEIIPILTDLISGCLFGGAMGDALGYAVEFMTFEKIISEYGENGITEFDLRHADKAQISDDTQMSLFTANGILIAETNHCVNGTKYPLSGYIFRAYEDWYRTQVKLDYSVPTMYINSCWIYNRKELHDWRAPGNTCLSALEQGSSEGTPDNPINNSKGCGGVMRVAPIGCVYARWTDMEKDVAISGAKAAALTHGHTLGYIPAAFLSCLIYKIIRSRIEDKKQSLYDLVDETMPVISELYGDKEHYNEFVDIIKKAVSLSKEANEDVDDIREIGEGWVAEETLAIALYSVLKYSNDFKKAIICAVNHDGDSDSTGAVAGNMLGSFLGLSEIDGNGEIRDKLELSDVILELSQDLALGCRMNGEDFCDPNWAAKYEYAEYGK